MLSQWISPAVEAPLMAFLAVLALAGLVGIPRALRRARGRAELRGAGGAEQGADALIDLPRPWRALRREVEMSNRAMPPAVFHHIRRLFLDYYADGKFSPAALTREWGQEEFLLVVDEQGRPMPPVLGMVERFRQTLKAHPAFNAWFREETFTEGEWQGAPTLLAARWLCHLLGLRHATVEIFLDPAGRPGHTLVQVRGKEKFEAPGAFDIPCAGHVSGLDSDLAALEKELREELNLSLDDLDDLRMLERYNSFSAAEDGTTGGESEEARWSGLVRRSINHEHRLLFRARLKPGAAERVRFNDGEVAALSAHPVEKVRALVRQSPERVASGLADAIGFYESAQD